jgi:hypothetical protein
MSSITTRMFLDSVLSRSSRRKRATSSGRVSSRSRPSHPMPLLTSNTAPLRPSKTAASAFAGRSSVKTPAPAAIRAKPPNHTISAVVWSAADLIPPENCSRIPAYLRNSKARRLPARDWSASPRAADISLKNDRVIASSLHHRHGLNPTTRIGSPPTGTRASTTRFFIDVFPEPQPPRRATTKLSLPR